jgi:hypothetical protein
LTLPFDGSGAATTTALFNITNTNPAHSAVAGNGAQGASQGHGGTGVSGYGGSSNSNDAVQSYAGDGVHAVGGTATSVDGIAGPGVTAYGGGGSAIGISGGQGVTATGGSGSTTEGSGSSGGDGIDAYGGSGAVVAGSGIYAVAGSGPSAYAGYFEGNVQVNGSLSKSSGTFQIDHPLDPANKYLFHSFVESPDMMNIYNGNVVTDSSGTAVVTMPAWFQALNTDFRYQLTTIGQPAQAWIATEIANGSFTIKTSKSGVKVSWQVTGVRQDAWANAHRVQVEVNKAPADQGHYLHPELFGHENEPNIPEIHHPRPLTPQQ